jgi:predicted DNA-binding transcriptional regulator AlpA
MSISSPPPADAEYLSAAQVKARFGNVSDMWIVRRMADHEFPKPVTFGTSARFWRVAELIAWEKLMLDRAVNAPPLKKVQPRKAG